MFFKDEIRLSIGEMFIRTRGFCPISVSLENLKRMVMNVLMGSPKLFVEEDKNFYLFLVGNI